MEQESCAEAGRASYCGNSFHPESGPLLLPFLGPLSRGQAGGDIINCGKEGVRTAGWGCEGWRESGQLSEDPGKSSSPYPGTFRGSGVRPEATGGAYRGNVSRHLLGGAGTRAEHRGHWQTLGNN